MKTRQRIAAVLCALVVCLSVTAADAKKPSKQFEAVVVFGDSLSDTGNLFAATTPPEPPLPVPFPPDPPYYLGRFSNGLVAVEQMASRLGLPAPLPSLLGGTNYAWGGAETGGGISSRETSNIGLQIETFLAEIDGTYVWDDKLFFVYGGANDFNNAVAVPDPAVIAANVVEHVRTLADAGARYFVVPDLPPLGQTPRFVGTPDQPLLDLLSIEFNIRLAIGLWKLEREMDVTIIRPSVFLLFQFMTGVPELFGFENVTGTAKIDPTNFFDPRVVDNPDAYLFFDDIHPTRVTHELIGGLAALKVRVLSKRFRRRR